MKKLLTTLMVSALVIACIFAPSIDANAATSGTCGNNLTWTLDDAGTLTISGTGAMKDYAYGSDAPWYGSRSSIKMIIIGNGVTTIGDRAFEQCFSLTSVTIPDSVTTIGHYAFSDCYSLTSITIGDSVTTIGDSAFEDCDSLTSVTMGNSVTTIGDWAFYSCASLTYNVYDNGRYLGNRTNPYVALVDTTSTSITSYTIHPDTKIIGEYAFSGCASLTRVTIPDSVTTIGNKAFSYCRSLTSVYYAGTAEQWKKISIGSENTDLTGATIHYGHRHDYSLVTPVTVPATCTATGYIEYTCIYGEKYREILPQLPHDYSGEKIIVEPSCMEEGYTATACIHCGMQKKEDIVPSLGGHNMVVITAKEATCTEPGNSAGSQCDRCGFVGIAVEIVPATGHSFVNNICTTCGLRIYTPGDLDGNEGVDEDDVIYLLQHLLMPEDYGVGQSVDYDNSGTFDESDVIYLLQHLLLPEAFPL